MNKTIVVVNDFDYIQGGASKVAINTAEILHDNNVNVIFFSAVHKDNNYKFKQVTTNQKECLTDGIKGAFRCLNNKKAAKEFSKLLDTLDKDNTIIHVHGWTKALSSSIFKVAHKKGFKLVLTQHDYFTVCPNGGFYNYNKEKICTLKPMGLKCVTCNCDSRSITFKMYRLLRQFIQNRNTRKLKRLKYVISISDFSIDKINKYLSKDVLIQKVYNPIEVDKEDIINIENNDKYLFVGRVSKEKGCDIFCEAITKANKKGLVVGSGSELEYLKNKYHNIEFAGWSTKEEVKEYMKNSKALILPSKWYEGAPLTPLEAQAIGLPCITSSNNAASEFIKDNITGKMFELSVDNLVNKINEYEKEDVIKYSNNCYNMYWENPFSSTIYYDNLIKAYNNIK